MKDIIVIVGPTGIGKTKLSIELAKKLDAEIINGDSVSIYKKLDIGSAKPTLEERVGGTGLYIKAALFDYNFTEGTTYNNYNDLSNEELLTRIKEYNIDKLPELNNRKRLVRLLNKLENNEEITNNKDKSLYHINVIGLETNREVLYERINNRVDQMLSNGLLEEIKSLKEYYPISRILNSAIGYKEFNDYLFNNGSLNDAIEMIKLNSRRFAKRQFTFFKNQFETKWFTVDLNNFNNTIEEVYDFIK